MLLVTILAETTSGNFDALAGQGSGWVGAGLLGCVLAWLMLWHLPAKDKQLKELLDGKDLQIQTILTAKDEQLRQLMTDKWERIEELQKEFADRLQEVTNHCERDLSKIVEAFRAENNRILDKIDALKIKD